jgi:DedD protein
MTAAVARARLGVKSEADEQARQRATLLRRVAVAGGLIAVLIGGLALFDASRKPAEPVPMAIAPPDLPAAAPEPPPAEETSLPELPPEEPPVEVAGVSLSETPPPLPEGTARPTAPGALEAEPPFANRSPETPGRLVIGGETPHSPAPSMPVRAPAAQAIARTPPPAEQGDVTGYRIQVGVFNSVANAEDVRTRLALKGIPSQIEARVHVGPFKSRAEADQARARLRTLGMDSGVPAPMRTTTAHR